MIAGALASLGSSLYSGANSFLGTGIGKLVGGAGSSLLGGALGNMFGASDRRDAADVGLASYAMQRAMDYDYAKKYNELNYQLAERTATNSALWAVQGLKRAGLNPILAAGGGFHASPSGGGVSPSGASADVGGNYPRIDIAEAMRDLASMDVSTASAKQLDSQTSLNKTNEVLVNANSAKANAEAVAIERKSLIDAITGLDAAIKGGEKGVGGFIERHLFSDQDNLHSWDTFDRRELPALQKEMVEKLKGTLFPSKQDTSSAKQMVTPQTDVSSHPVISSAKQRPSVLRSVSEKFRKDGSIVPPFVRTDRVRERFGRSFLRRAWDKWSSHPTVRRVMDSYDRMPHLR